MDLPDRGEVMYINDSDFTGCMIVVVLAVILAPLGIWKLVEWLWPILQAAVAAGWAAL